MNAVKDLVKSGKTAIGTAGSATGDMAMLADAGFRAWEDAARREL